MTSSSEQPPKEYIITEEQLNKISFDYVSNVYDPGTTVHDRASYVEAIRKRPHPAPAHKICCASCPCREPNCEDDCRDWLKNNRRLWPDNFTNPIESDKRGYRCIHCDIDGDAQFCHYHKKQIVTLPYHDAAIARKAREETLRGKLEIIDSVITEFGTSVRDDMQVGFLNGLLYSRTRIFGSEQESLRTTTPHTEQDIIPDPDKLQHFSFKHSEQEERAG